MPKPSPLQRILILITIFIGLVPFVHFATVQTGIAEAADEDSTHMENPADLERYVENFAFGVGEKFYYDVNYGFINAGTATMGVERMIEFDGRPAYQVVSTANSNSFFSSFYKVEDRLETIVDALGVFSWKFSKNLREGNYKADRKYTFNQREQYTVYEGDTIEVAPYVQDALSLLYYTRTQQLEVGNSIFIDNFIDGKKYVTEVKVLKRETIDVEAGTFDCLVVEPLLQSAGVFKHEGSLTVWLTNDRLKMPVLMKSKVLVGSISAELTDYELGEIVEF